MTGDDGTAMALTAVAGIKGATSKGVFFKALTLMTEKPRKFPASSTFSMTWSLDVSRKYRASGRRSPRGSLLPGRTRSSLFSRPYLSPPLHPIDELRCENKRVVTGNLGDHAQVLIADASPDIEAVGESRL